MGRFPLPYPAVAVQAVQLRRPHTILFKEYHYESKYG